ncbi:MAG: alpha-1,4-glucan--maltose-1-phosphate maltosyltransferase [Bdellovibrionales bacterium RIFOXYD1_FULL_53_11]|nr:MAG: alpha-1,4-glucan--maltose-1-phosphate maltosyltransferase [Bdellovibrionales bacterium RIFOXYD1_FULL_53_11]
MLHSNGAARAVIDNIKPELSGGLYPVKRIKGDIFHVEATVFCDGHDALACSVLYKHERDKDWSEARMSPSGKKDVWAAGFKPKKTGLYHYTVQSWIDRFETWKHDIMKKHEAGQDIRVEIKTGTGILEKARSCAAEAADKAEISRALKLVKAASAAKDTSKTAAAVHAVASEALSAAMLRSPDKAHASTYPRQLGLIVDRKQAAFSAWYEFFPRSTSGSTKRHGTFKDSEKMLKYISSLGFDVVYLPPIHPVGATHRKGRNNSLAAGARDPGSPWGIGSPDGGHKAVHPELGTIKDFKRFVKKARSLKLEVALDIALQCSPDHPYVKEHPEWFKKRADGSIQYAENPPKKYQDIYPFNFESRDWRGLWKELRSIFKFWIGHGVKIFRVDNPHTKSFAFWRWLLDDLRHDHPDLIFLAEAFTRPAIMYNLAKTGYTQSYTYFTWRYSPKEFKDYLEELTRSELAEHFRPNFWPNTPDILPPYLQKGERAAFVTRFALAAALSSNYGIYGPPFELLEHVPIHQGSEEYLNSEKYEIRSWNLASRKSIAPFIAQMNKIRRANPALQRTGGIVFHNCLNEKLLCFTKQTPDRKNTVLVVASFDFSSAQSGTVELQKGALGFDDAKPVKANDLLSGGPTALWEGDTRQFKLDCRVNTVLIYKLSQ